MSDTKEKILDVSLELFSCSGYEAVSVSDIAGRLDMTKGALYKHFKNKQDIFDSLVTRMEQLYSTAFAAFDADSCEEYSHPDLPEALKAVLCCCTSLFSFWTGDPFACRFRKMLILEQYGNSEMSRLYKNYFVSGPMEQLTELLRSHHVPGASEKAVTLYSAVYLFYSVLDSAEDRMCTSAVLKENIERLCFKVIG